MAEITIRPSTLLIKLSYAVAAVLTIALAGFGGAMLAGWSWYWLVFFVPGIIALRAAIRHFQSRFTLLEIEGDRMKYESGIFSRTTRSMPLAKVQDVTVNQSFGQRLVGIGDLSIETAGEAGRLTIHAIGSPRQVAEQILDRVSAHSPDRKNP